MASTPTTPIADTTPPEGAALTGAAFVTLMAHGDAQTPDGVRRSDRAGRREPRPANPGSGRGLRHRRLPERPIGTRDRPDPGTSSGQPRCRGRLPKPGRHANPPHAGPFHPGRSGRTRRFRPARSNDPRAGWLAAAGSGGGLRRRQLARRHRPAPARPGRAALHPVPVPLSRRPAPGSSSGPLRHDPAPRRPGRRRPARDGADAGRLHARRGGRRSNA